MTVRADGRRDGIDQARCRFNAPSLTPIHCGRQTGPPEEEGGTQKKEGCSKLLRVSSY